MAYIASLTSACSLEERELYHSFINRAESVGQNKPSQDGTILRGRFAAPFPRLFSRLFWHEVFNELLARGLRTSLGVGLCASRISHAARMTAAFWSLINTAGLATLDRGPRPGIADAATIRRLLAVTVRGLAEKRHDAALALALLWHDHFDDAHQLCQAHEGHADCDYVHALLHRREGDFANAKYWFGEVGAHPLDLPLAQAAQALGRADLLERGRWRPAAMVDACALALGGDQVACSSLMQLQAVEFHALGEHLVAR
jgi:hypothetical protein